MPKTKQRCPWVGINKPFYEVYHDLEWGAPQHDDARLFEFLILEGAQAGLSWETILKKREGYRKAFHNFNAKQVAKMSDQELMDLVGNPGIVRNRLKIASARKNALVFLAIQKEFGSFDAYLWGFVGGKPICNGWKTMSEVPTKTVQSDALSKDLKKRGMNFVGSTIMYAFMQAVGLVDDHLVDCWRHGKSKARASVKKSLPVKKSIPSVKS